ncbi:MAG: CHAT domain-containing protein [Bryobacteraceae bacterium]|nr:CHAT domain-containing protein [Bryobacterales bacterium]MEB2362354.1 CHAT domain-containing protein [Bryobacterales bacterium]NUN02820.1 CHAT domain-containing protein [Bryobacteraceae bacterium]
MRFATVATGFLLLLLPNVSSRPGSIHSLPPNSSNAFLWNDTAFRELRQKAFDSLGKGRFLQAAALYEHGFKVALEKGDTASAIRVLNNLGAAHLYLLQYRRAMQVYIRAKDLASRTGDAESGPAISGNIASIYLQMGDEKSAWEEIQQALDDLAPETSNAVRTRLFILAGVIQSYVGDLDTTTRYFGAAIAAADAEADPAMEAQAWDHLGGVWQRAGDLDRAEIALTNAFRLRKLNGGKDLFLSYPKLGLLRLAQGDLRSAEVLMNRAIETSRQASAQMPLWTPYHRRGLVKKAAGKLREALGDFQTAIDMVRVARLEVIPVASLKNSSNVELHDVYSSFIETACALYLETRARRYAEMGLQAAQEIRALALRDRVGDLESRLPAEYWERLAQLRAAQAAAFRNRTAAVDDRIGRLNVELNEMEARAGLEAQVVYSSAPGAVRDFGLDRDELLLSFHITPNVSVVWALTDRDLELRPLPPEKVIARQVAGFQHAVQTGSANAAAQGAELYRTLFDGLPEQALARKRWKILLDGPLYKLPFAALVDSFENEKPRYLVENHVLLALPAILKTPGTNGCDSGLFVAAGDPIYNQADSRWRGRRTPRAARKTGSLFSLFGWGGDAEESQSFELARLPGTGREIRACANVWAAKSGVKPELLSGAEANWDSIRATFARKPAVVHIASHVVSSPMNPEEAMIALSLGPDGSGDFVGPLQISALRFQTGIVVMSGCNSGTGEALPGAGLMGLTRAWLHGGAGAVAATHWPVTDDEGKLLVRFYEHLHQLKGGSAGARAAEALHLAQRDFLKVETGQIDARDWPAYFVVGKE